MLFSSKKLEKASPRHLTKKLSYSSCNKFSGERIVCFESERSFCWYEIESSARSISIVITNCAVVLTAGGIHVASHEYAMFEKLYDDEHVWIAAKALKFTF